MSINWNKHAVAVVTQAFLRAPRGDKARLVIRGDHMVLRALTIFDEQTRDVEVYDLQQSIAARVKEEIERHLHRLDIKAKLQPLVDFIYVKDKGTGNTAETPKDDPHGWLFARGAGVVKVFGFAAQMYNNCAFVYRRGAGDNGTHFMGYVPATPPKANSILLDATAEIDRVSELCSWRTHVHPYLSGNLNELFRKEANRRSSKGHVIQVIRGVKPVGARGLLICRKALMHSRNQAAGGRGGKIITPFTWDLDGRHLAVTWWGGHGIGVNDWKEAEYVFQFGEHILPDRIMFAMVQGLRGDKATSGMLSTTKSSNRRPHEFEADPVEQAFRGVLGVVLLKLHK